MKILQLLFGCLLHRGATGSTAAASKIRLPITLFMRSDLGAHTLGGCFVAGVCR